MRELKRLVRTPRATDYETPEGDSMTVPDESLSVREILDRFTKGKPMDVSERQPGYDSEADFDTPDIEKLNQLDPFEREQYLNDVRSLIREYDLQEKRKQTPKKAKPKVEEPPKEDDTSTTGSKEDDKKGDEK